MVFFSCNIWIIDTKFDVTQKKVQIVLTHTSRTLFDYMVSIKYRFGGKPLKLPHYLVGRDGTVFDSYHQITRIPLDEIIAKLMYS